LLSDLIGATWGEMSQGANGAGGWLAGAVPHRLPMGEPQENDAFSAQDMWQQPRKGYVLLNCEPEFDTATPRFAIDALKQAESVIVLSAYDNPLSREYADVLLPVTPISEMAGTYVNALGDWQSFQAAVKPLGESRPAWKVLRVLGNLCDVRHFHYENVGEVLQEILNHPKKGHYEKDALLKMPNLTRDVKLQTTSQLIRIAPTPLYAVDSVTRRARSLQETLDAKMAVVRIHSEQAKQQQLIEGQKVWVMQDGMTTLEPLPIQIDDRLPVNTALVASSLYETQSLGEPFGMIQLIAVEDE
jgi:NADH-quinone oxidoreductase subunit G